MRAIRLTVRGATVIRRDGSVHFLRGDITVLLGPNTIVTRDGGGHNLLRPIAISVGQRIHAFGDVTATPTVDSLTLDATAGRVRMKLTHLSGSVVSAVPGQVALDLFSIDGRRPGIFDFAGTGAAPATDADPLNYEVATGALDVLGLTPDSPARVFGFVTPFGFAPPDFVGRTVVDVRDLRAELGIGWGADGTSAPFLSMGDTGLVVDAANPDLGLRHHIRIGFRLIDITGLGLTRDGGALQRPHALCARRAGPCRALPRVDAVRGAPDREAERRCQGPGHVRAWRV